MRASASVALYSRCGRFLAETKKSLESDFVMRAGRFQETHREKTFFCALSEKKLRRTEKNFFLCASQIAFCASSKKKVVRFQENAKIEAHKRKNFFFALRKSNFVRFRKKIEAHREKFFFLALAHTKAQREARPQRLYSATEAETVNGEKQ